MENKNQPESIESGKTLSRLETESGKPESGCGKMISLFYGHANYEVKCGEVNPVSKEKVFCRPKCQPENQVYEKCGKCEGKPLNEVCDKCIKWWQRGMTALKNPVQSPQDLPKLEEMSERQVKPQSSPTVGIQSRSQGGLPIKIKNPAGDDSPAISPQFAAKDDDSYRKATVKTVDLTVDDDSSVSETDKKTDDFCLSSEKEKLLKQTLKGLDGASKFHLIALFENLKVIDKEFLLKENRLIDLLFKNVISIPEFWAKRNKLAGEI